jgi:hypothetical protein
VSDPSERYIYRNADGTDSYRVTRSSGKSFYIHSKDGTEWHRGLNGSEPIPYHLPEVLLAKNRGEPIWVVEGEKDANTAATIGLVATTNHGGAGKWREQHSHWLRGAEEVIIVWDRDDEGRKHAWIVHDSLAAVGVETIRFRRAAYGKDLTDHIGEGGTLDQLVDQKPRRPKPKPKKRRRADVPIDDTPLVFQLILERLQGVKPELGKDHQYNAICPAHDDTRPSLSVKLGEERVFLKCQAGCEFDDIVAALGLKNSDLVWKEADESDHDRQVQVEVEKLLIRQEARIQVESLTAGFEYDIELLNRISLKEELAEPETAERFLIDEMMPHDGRTMIVAEEKAGKTRFCLSLCKALCDSDQFLGRAVTFTGRICYLNGEMSKSMFVEWVRQAEFDNPDRLIAKHLRGQTFPFWRQDYMERVADWLALMKIELLIIDTQYIFMRGFVTNENDNLEVSRWQGAVDALRNLAGVANVLVVHHRGHSEDMHGRGASAIGAWPDVTWYLSKMGDKVKGERLPQDAPRSLALNGRIATFEPIELEYDLGTGLYKYGHISRKEGINLRRFAEWIDRLKVYYADNGRWPGRDRAKRLIPVKADMRDDVFLDALGRGIVELVEERGVRGGKIMRVVPKG